MRWGYLHQHLLYYYILEQENEPIFLVSGVKALRGNRLLASISNFAHLRILSIMSNFSLHLLSGVILRIEHEWLNCLLLPRDLRVKMQKKPGFILGETVVRRCWLTYIGWNGLIWGCPTHTRFKPPCRLQVLILGRISGIFPEVLSHGLQRRNHNVLRGTSSWMQLQLHKSLRCFGWAWDEWQMCGDSANCAVQ